METDVVIIGAGAAGLAAARALARRSLRVTLLDGRDRIGGRVKWQRVGSVTVPAELGAEFIHGAAPETAVFLREAGLEQVATGEMSWTCGDDGVLRPETGAAAESLFERARTLAQDESVESFLQRFEPDPLLREQARQARFFVEGFEAADPRLASARAIADELGTGVDETSSRPVGSYAPLFDWLAADCVRASVDIRLSTVAEHVTWNTGSVVIAARAVDGSSSCVRARCAIITVPVGVLRRSEGAARLAFDPPLPAEKQMALHGLEMGQVVRVTLAFRSPFWETVDGGRYREAAFFRCERGAFNAFWTQLPLRDRTIVAWAGGPRATALIGLPEAEWIARARAEFGALFGQGEGASAEFEGGVTHDWSADPFALGAYSYVLAGAGGVRAALGKPVGDTLFFAGEATSTDGQGGTVSGAFGSGMRAAGEAAAVHRRSAAPQIGP